MTTVDKRLVCVALDIDVFISNLSLLCQYAQLTINQVSATFVTPLVYEKKVSTFSSINQVYKSLFYYLCPTVYLYYRYTPSTHVQF